MLETVILKNTIPVQVRTSARARQARISVNGDGTISAVFPERASYQWFIKFLESKVDWIEQRVAYFMSHPVPVRKTKLEERREFLLLREQARTIAHERLTHFNQFYGFTYHRVTIRNQKSRWGSCSKKGNLNFNYKIATLPPELLDYIIVHELCHLGELNHSQKFWNLVGRTVPNYKELRRELKRLH